MADQWLACRTGDECPEKKKEMFPAYWHAGMVEDRSVVLVQWDYFFCRG